MPSMPDMSILSLLKESVNDITGVSEYVLGQSAGERTATGANSVATSVNRRMIPMMKQFIHACSLVADMWLSLVQDNWTQKEFVRILDDQGNATFQALNNQDLLGEMEISLDMEGLAGASDALKYNKILSTLQVLMPIP